MKMFYKILILLSVINGNQAIIKNIIFDIGGVILADGPEYFVQTLTHKEERNAGSAIVKSVVWDDWNQGEISCKELSNILIKQHFDPKLVTWIITETLNPNRPFVEETVTIIKQLKNVGYNLYILSNFSEEAYRIFINSNNNLFDLFDGMIFSYQIGCLKPDHPIYNKLLEAYHLSVEESLFIDDSAKNINSAKDLGILGILYKKGTLAVELKKLGINLIENLND